MKLGLQKAEIVCCLFVHRSDARLKRSTWLKQIVAFGVTFHEFVLVRLTFLEGNGVILLECRLLRAW